MKRISLSAHMGQQSQLGRTQAACERHVEEDDALAELEGTALTRWEAITAKRNHLWGIQQNFGHCPPAPQHDWLLNIETPSYMEMTDDAEDQRLAG